MAAGGVGPASSKFQDTFLLSQVSWAGISRHMTVLCYPLVAPLLTGKRRSTVEPGTREDSLWLALQHGCTARDSSRIGRTRLHATDVYGHITLATAVPPPGEGRAPAAGTNRAPRGDRQAPAVDEGPFLSRTQGSSANSDGG